MGRAAVRERRVICVLVMLVIAVLGETNPLLQRGIVIEAEEESIIGGGLPSGMYLVHPPHVLGCKYTGFDQSPCAEQLWTFWSTLSRVLLHPERREHLITFWSVLHCSNNRSDQPFECILLRRLSLR